MERFYCNNCKEFFSDEEADYEKEFHSELAGMGGNLYEEFMVCPNCGSDYFEKAYECELCGKPTITEFCDECVREAKKRIYKFTADYAREMGCKIETIVDLLHLCVE